jgi:hypothetical protein
MITRSVQSLGFMAVALVASGLCVWQIVTIRRNGFTLAGLRAEITRDNAALRQMTPPRDAPAAPKPEPVGAAPEPGDETTPGTAELTGGIRVFLHQVADLKHWFESTAGASIPELRFLSEHTWVEQTAALDLTSEAATRRTAAKIRTLAMFQFVEQQVKPALDRYETLHGGMLPGSMSELAALLPDDARSILDRYELLVTGPRDTPAANRAIGIRPEAVVDSEYDPAFYITGFGAGWAVYREGDPTPVFVDLAVGRAQARFAAAHNGEVPQDIEPLLPYFTNPADGQRALERQKKSQEEIARRVVLPRQ